jgi:hypothetical protein
LENLLIGIPVLDKKLVFLSKYEISMPVPEECFGSITAEQWLASSDPAQEPVAWISMFTSTASATCSDKS